MTREGKIISVMWGGDTDFAVDKFHVAKDIMYLSTAGGAFLAYLGGEKMPGLVAMEDAAVLKEE